MQEVVSRWRLRPSGGRMPHPVRDLMAAAERETAAAPLERWRMHRSHRFLLRMSIFLGLVAALAYQAPGFLAASRRYQKPRLARPLSSSNN